MLGGVSTRSYSSPVHRVALRTQCVLPASCLSPQQPCGGDLRPCPRPHVLSLLVPEGLILRPPVLLRRSGLPKCVPAPCAHSARQCAPCFWGPWRLSSRRSQQVASAPLLEHHSHACVLWSTLYNQP